MPQYICPERGPAPGLLVMMHQDFMARARIQPFCRRWVSRRRARRTREWATFIHLEALVPGAILALPHILLAIGACL